MIMKKDALKIPRAPLSVVFDREEDGRWIAEVKKLPGVLAYGKTKQEARTKAYAIALRTLADTVEQGRTPSSVSKMFYAVVRG